MISISGIRGTIGGRPAEGLTPIDTVQFASAYAAWLIRDSGKERPSVALGRDARISGPMVEQLVTATLSAMGVDVYLMGFATTPTVEIAVTEMEADGGIILTASHNPAQWNALKLLNCRGEFLSGEDGEAILRMARANEYSYADVKMLGEIKPLAGMDVKHIDQVIELDLVKPEKIRRKKVSRGNRLCKFSRRHHFAGTCSKRWEWRRSLSSIVIPRVIFHIIRSPCPRISLRFLN